MRFLISILLMAVVCVAGENRVTNGRLIANFSAIPANRVVVIKTAIKNQYEAADLFTNRWVSVEWGAETNNGVISGWVDLGFSGVGNQKLLQVWNAITNYAYPAGITGVITAHLCMIDPTNTTGWGGCNLEPDAHWMEFRIR